MVWIYFDKIIIDIENPDPTWDLPSHKRVAQLWTVPVRDRRGRCCTWWVTADPGNPHSLLLSRAGPTAPGDPLAPSRPVILSPGHSPSPSSRARQSACVSVSECRLQRSVTTYLYSLEMTDDVCWISETLHSLTRTGTGWDRGFQESSYASKSL